MQSNKQKLDKRSIALSPLEKQSGGFRVDNVPVRIPGLAWPCFSPSL